MTTLNLPIPADQQTLNLIRDAVETKKQMFREESNGFNEKAEQLNAMGDPGVAGHVNMGKNFGTRADKLQAVLDSWPVTLPPPLPT